MSRISSANPRLAAPGSVVADRRSRQSWAMSILLHLVLSLAIVISFIGGKPEPLEPERKGRIVVTVVSAEDNASDYLDESSFLPATEVLTAESEPAQLTPWDRLSEFNQLEILPRQASDPLSSGRTSLAGPGAAQITDANDMLRVGSSRAMALERPMTAEDFRRIEEEQALVAARLPVGEPIALSVFGSGPLIGRKFVFVIDQSASMGEGGLGVISVSKRELASEIGKLHSYHQFQIVAYNDRTTTINKRSLLSATEQNKSDVEPFMNSLVAVGGTNHEGALMVALGFEPDVVVLISDGGEPFLDSNRLALIQKVIDPRTQIHCLQFGDRENPDPTNHFMRELASQNRGTYRYIDVRKWISAEK